MLRNFKQEDLATAIDITFQQIQKYETGKNRIAASTLHDLAMALQISPQDFYAGAHNTTDDNGEEMKIFAENHKITGFLARINNRKIKSALKTLITELAETDN